MTPPQVAVNRKPNPVVHRHVWAIVFPNGRIITGTDLEDEDHAWEIAMGWPHADEIEEQKKLGTFAAKAVLTYRPPTP